MDVSDYWRQGRVKLTEWCTGRWRRRWPSLALLAFAAWKTPIPERRRLRTRYIAPVSVHAVGGLPRALSAANGEVRRLREVNFDLRLIPGLAFGTGL
jgi:hypothetical protein